MITYTVQRHYPSGEAFALRYDGDQITGAVHLDAHDLAIVERDPSALLNPDYDDPDNLVDPGGEQWQSPEYEYAGDY